MVTRTELLKRLPPFQGDERVINWGQSVPTITYEVIKAHERFETDYDAIFDLFDTGDIYTTCQGLWEFCKYNLKYNIESTDEQSVKTPAAILQPGAKVDCKHYSLFIGGVLDAIKAAYGGDWDWCYRFVSDKPDRIIGHVFVVVMDHETGQEIDIDPVLATFNEKHAWTKVTDSKPVTVCLSGVGDVMPTDLTKYKYLFLAAVVVVGLSLRSR